MTGGKKETAKKQGEYGSVRADSFVYRCCRNGYVVFILL
jgi:hypothetical protein